MFKLTVVEFNNQIDGKDTIHQHLISFMHSNNWNRAPLVLQSIRLFPNGNHYTIDDGVKTFTWYNDEDDINRVIRELNGM